MCALRAAASRRSLSIKQQQQQPPQAPAIKPLRAAPHTTDDAAALSDQAAFDGLQQQRDQQCAGSAAASDADALQLPGAPRGLASHPIRSLTPPSSGTTLSGSGGGFASGAGMAVRERTRGGAVVLRGR